VNKNKVSTVKDIDPKLNQTTQRNCHLTKLKAQMDEDRSRFSYGWYDICWSDP